MSMFKEVADIQTADMLKLPVPKAEYKNIAVKPSDIQSEMVKSLSERAEKVRNGGVDSSQDNMLLITNDGRKLALDQRMIDLLLPDFEGSKVNALVDNVYRIWDETTPNKSAQLIFCDLSTPKSSNDFSVYNDIRDKLIKKVFRPMRCNSFMMQTQKRRKPSYSKRYAQVKSEFLWVQLKNGCRHQCAKQIDCHARFGLPLETCRFGTASRKNYPSRKRKL